MPVVDSLFVCVHDRAVELGCSLPESIAILPENFCAAESRLNLLIRAESVTLRNLLESSDVPLESFFRLGEHPTFGHDNGASWQASLFVPATLLSRNPNAVSTVLTAVSNHLGDFFKGHAHKQINLVLVVERKRDMSCRKLTYEGDVAGLSALAEQIHRIAEG